MNITQLDLGYVNAYLVEENGTFMLVDTGGYLFADKSNLNNRREILEEKLQAAGVTKQNLQLIFLTHGDSDHCMNAKYISEKYEVPIAMHEADIELVNNQSMEVLMRTVNYRSIIMKVMAKLIHGTIIKLMQKTMQDFECFTPDILLKDGDSLEEYGFHAMVIGLPGHTPGSIGIVTSDNEAIVGDAGPGTINVVNFAAFDKSLSKIESADYKVIYMGHKNPVRK